MKITGLRPGSHGLAGGTGKIDLTRCVCSIAAMLDKMRARTYFPELESLRGLAAMSVVMLHVIIFIMFLSPDGNAARTITQIGLPPYLVGLAGMTLFNGRSAVTLFFVLSGFVMGVNMDSSRVLSTRDYSAFLIRRFFRLMPAIWAAVFFALSLQYTVEHQTHGWRQIVDFLVLQDLNIGPLWTMIMEIAASLFYPLMLVVARRMSTGIQLLALFAAARVEHLHLLPVHYMFDFNFPLYQFYLGLIIPTVGRAMIDRLSPRVAGGLAVAAFAVYCAPAPALAAIELGRDNLQRHLADGRSLYDLAASLLQWMDVIVPLAAFYMIAWTIYGSHRIIKPVLNSRACSFLGRVSYSIYILHGPITNAAKALIEQHHIASSSARLLLGLALVVPVTLLASAINYRWVEAPAIKAGKRIAGHLQRPLNPAFLSDRVGTMGAKASVTAK
jgi:peptidoglycan/LPS O-acetylase OafA/YrhL